MPVPENVLIVGASLAGLRTAQALRRQGYAGPIRLLGDEIHLPYDRPPLSKDVLAGKWDPERTALLRPEDDELELVWQLGARATSLDLAARRVGVAGGEDVAFDALVITTGASPRWIPGTEHCPGAFVLRSLDDCLALRTALDASPRVAVIGAGFIGAEVAATCRERGLETTVIEALDLPLERSLGARLGAMVADLHRDHGVDLRLGTGVRELLRAGPSGPVTGVALDDGTTVDADVVVVGIGVAPNTGWLEGSGLEVDDGVVCDTRCRAAAGVVAAGDVARWTNPLFDESMRLEHWTNATEQADAAAEALLRGDAAEPFAPVPFFWSDQYDRKIQFAGRAGPDDETVLVDGSLAERRFVQLYARDGRLRGVLGWNRPRLVMKFRRLIREGASLADALDA